MDTESMKTGICGTAVTPLMLESIVRFREAWKLGPSFRLTSLESNLIGEGRGNNSDVVRLLPQWENGDSVPSSLVLKVPSKAKIERLFGSVSPEAAAGLAALVPTLHAKECRIFRFLRQQPPEGVPVPKVYAMREMGDGGPGYLLMEDMSEGSQRRGLHNSLNKAQLEQIFVALAHWAAFCVEQEEELGSSVEAFPKDAVRGYCGMMPAAYDKLVQLRPELFQEHKDSVIRWPDMAEGMWAAEERAVRDLHQPRIVAHGDLHASNIVFAQDGSMRGLLDWQAVHPGLAVEDVGTLLATSVNADVRRRHTPALLRLYHETLSRLLPQRHVGSLEELRLALWERWPSSVAAFCAALPGLLEGRALARLGAGERAAAVEALLARAAEGASDASLDRRWT